MNVVINCCSNIGRRWSAWQNACSEVETLNAAEFQALMRGETPVEDSSVTLRGQESPAGASKTTGPVRGDDKRADSGLDLGGRVPQPV
jgi:hypothetical protein